MKERINVLIDLLSDELNKLECYNNCPYEEYCNAVMNSCNYTSICDFIIEFNNEINNKED